MSVSTIDINDSNILDSIAGELPAASEPTVHERIFARAAMHPDRVALIDGVSGATTTYAAMTDTVVRVAQGLRNEGFGPGDVLAIHAPNSPEWLILALAAIYAGGIVTGVNPGYGPQEISHQLSVSQATIVATTRSGLDTIVQVEPPVAKALLLDGSGALTFEGLAATDIEGAAAPASSSGQTTVAMPFSSGTSGTAKGVVITHESLGAVLDQVAIALPTDGQVILGFLPMFHIMGFSVVALTSLAGGGTLVTLPGFDPPQFLGAIQAHRVTQLFVVPPVMAFMAGHPLVGQFDLSSLELVGCGAAPLPPTHEAAVAARFGCVVAQGYGMTESSGIITLPTLKEYRPGTSGRLVAGTQACIVDAATGETLPPTATGEIWFRGPQVAAGYRDDAEATAETFVDGWCRTGDIGSFDDDGFLSITDRLKELIKVKGYQVAPAELEAILVSHDGVVDAAVVGRPDERSGEVPVAFVVADPALERALDPDEVVRWVAERVVDYKCPAEIVICDSIPKNPSGKILRRVLRDQVNAVAAP